MESVQYRPERTDGSRHPALLFILLIIGWLSPLQAADKLTLVTGNDYPPFSDSRLHQGGVLTALVRQVLAQDQWAHSIDFKPWTRGYEETLRLQYGATFPYIKTPERAELFEFSDPLYQLGLRLYVHPDSGWSRGTEEELEEALFCLPVGYEVSGWVADAMQRLAFVRPRTMQQCHEMLLRGRVDVLISNRAEVAYQLQSAKRQLPQPRELPEPLADVTLHLIIPSHHPQARELIDRFNRNLRALDQDEGRSRLFSQHPDYSAAATHAD